MTVRWGFKPDGPRHQNMRAAISASTAAVAAMHLADLGYNAEQNLARAATYLQWIERHCIDDQGLAMDGLKRRRSGRWALERKRWTYNTGLVVLANAMLYQRTGKDWLLRRVRRSADAAIDRSGQMYDELVTDPHRNYFADTSYFASHLIEALMKASRVLSDPKYRDEAERNAACLYSYIRSPSNGLYFRNMRLWRLDRAHYQQFQSVWSDGYDKEELRFDPAADERSRESTELTQAVADRTIVRTLLASAAVARAFWSLADEPQIAN